MNWPCIKLVADHRPNFSSTNWCTAYGWPHEIGSRKHQQGLAESSSCYHAFFLTLYICHWLMVAISILQLLEIAQVLDEHVSSDSFFFLLILTDHSSSCECLKEFFYYKWLWQCLISGILVMCRSMSLNQLRSSKSLTPTTCESCSLNCEDV